MSKKNLSAAVQLILFLALGVGLILWRYNAMPEDERAEMFEAFRNVRLWWSLPVVVVGFLSHFFRALRWKLLMQPLGIRPDTTNTTFAVLIGYLANTLVPRLGEVAKCTVLAKYEDVPADKMVGTVIAERAFDFLCLIFLFFATLFLQYETLFPFAKQLYAQFFLTEEQGFQWQRLLLLAAGLLVLSLLALRFLRGKKQSKVGKIVTNIFVGLKSIAHTQQKGLFLLYTLLIWFLYILMAVIGFWAIPGLEQVPLWAALSVITFGSIGMIVTPGGIGAYPIFVAQVLILYGINEGMGTAYGWVSWTANTAVVLLFGILSLIFLPIYNRKDARHDQREKYSG